MTARSPHKRFKPGHVSLERALSKLGIASRTQARAAILAGQVRVNGIERRDPGFAVVPERAKIEMQGEKVEKAEPRTYVLHKPRGVVTTRVDEKGRPTVFGLLEKEGVHLIAVGRLDWATSGVLILTNDTRMADALTDPRTGIKRVYLVTVRGRVEPEGAARLMRGLSDGRDALQADAVEIRKASGKETHLFVTLTEGKNREIRRMFDALGHPVTKLKRVSYGGVVLDDFGLQPGEYRELTPADLARAFPELGR